ncbi:MAG: hypothetical protein NUV50_04425 [Rhodospirillales bacterium]|nr:hypothetical protein [Rhodospirillales bacterium]
MATIMTWIKRVPWIVKLNTATAVIVMLASPLAVIPIFAPNSEAACIIERFQTVFTGVVAALAVLVTAGFVYRAAKMPLEDAAKRDKANASALRTAGAATLSNAIQAIELLILSEAGKPQSKRRGKLCIPDALPDLEVIKTQDVETIKMLSAFITLAGIVDAHNVNGTWPYDPQKTNPEEEELLDKIGAKRKELGEHLLKIIDPPSPKDT